jgi:hypothetical protein
MDAPQDQGFRRCRFRRSPRCRSSKSTRSLRCFSTMSSMRIGAFTSSPAAWAYCASRRPPSPPPAAARLVSRPHSCNEECSARGATLEWHRTSAIGRYATGRIPLAALHKLRPLPSVFANIRCGFATASRERHGLWRSRLRELIRKSRDISGNCPCLARLIPRAMEHQAALLLWRFGLNKPHRRPLVLLKAQLLKAQAPQPGAKKESG